MEKNAFEAVVEKVDDVIANINNIVSWFDFSLFLKELVKVFCISFIIKHGFLNVVVLAIYLSVREIATSNSSQAKMSKEKIAMAVAYQFSFSFAIRFSTMFLLGVVPLPSLILLIFIRVCLHSTLDSQIHLEDKLLLENMDEETLTHLLQRLGTQVPEWLKSPEYERVEWLNKILTHRWPQIGAYLEDHIRYKILPEVNFLRDKSVMSGHIPPRVSSVKLKEVNEKIILLDVNILYDGDISATYEFKSGIELEMQQIKIDANLTLELKNFVGHFPFVKNVTVHMDTLPKVNIKFKKAGSIIESFRLALANSQVEMTPGMEISAEIRFQVIDSKCKRLKLAIA
ncbi:hypothetical protein SK128_001758 [Halocaridina rubra]|uniref:Synaptotagmin SMP domain-containing protein n=1 Tax=Halocaridina rubra TaxID=373956 RepID=A0AAN8XE47_HALRR